MTDIFEDEDTENALLDAARTSVDAALEAIAELLSEHDHTLYSRLAELGTAYARLAEAGGLL